MSLIKSFAVCIKANEASSTSPNASLCAFVNCHLILIPSVSTIFSLLSTSPSLTNFPAASTTGSPLFVTLKYPSLVFIISSKNSQPLWFKSSGLTLISTPLAFATASNPLSLEILFKCVSAFCLFQTFR